MVAYPTPPTEEHKTPQKPYYIRRQTAGMQGAQLSQNICNSICPATGREDSDGICHCDVNGKGDKFFGSM